MWEYELQKLLDEYVGKKVREDLELDDIQMPKKYNGYLDIGSIDEDGDGEIEVCICEKQYGLSGEERKWKACHYLVITITEFCIEEIYIHDRVYGNNSLGDYDPSEVFSHEAYFDQAICFMKKIVRSKQ